MSKRAYRAAARVKPCGEAGLAKMRVIVAEHQMAKVNEFGVDLFSASAVVAVCDKLSPANREKLLGFPVPQVVSLAFKVVGLAE